MVVRSAQWIRAGLTLVGTVLGLLVVGVANAGTLEVTETLSMSFGVISKPSVGSQTFTLDPLTGTVRAGPGDGKVVESGRPATFSVTGDPDASIHVSVALGPFSGSGITALEASVEGPEDTATLALGPTGLATLRLGGRISVSSQATRASQTATVVVTVAYE